MKSIDKKPALVFLSDTHIREDTPKARTDDYQAAMWKKLDQVLSTADRLGVPILHAGDFFNKPRVSQKLESKIIEKLRNFIVHVVPGQHDLPHHNIGNIYSSSLGVLDSAWLLGLLHSGGGQVIDANKSIVACGFHWGHDLDAKKEVKANLKIAVVHATVVKDSKDMWPGAVGVHTASALLNKLDCFDLVITGDNHKPFMHTNKKKQVLVNCGSMMRMSADQEDHKPAFYVLRVDEDDSRKFEVETIPFEIEQGVLTRDHIVSEAQRDERIGLFVESLDRKYKKGFSFRDNVEGFLGRNKVRKPIQDIIWEAFDEQ